MINLEFGQKTGVFFSVFCPNSNQMAGNVMINKITDNFINWCRRYNQESTARHKREALLLMEQVSRVESIITLQELLKASPPPLYTPSFFGQDTIDPFIKKRNELTETVNARAKINIQTICTQLDSLSTNDLTKDLVDLIKEMLSISNVLLHEHVPKLLHKLADISAVQTIIDHLGEQPTNPRPIRPHRGSFDAVPALSDKHQTCLDLLRNNSKTFNDANNNCCQANNFLQNFLSIYQEIHTHPSEPLPEQKDKASCIIQ